MGKLVEPRGSGFGSHIEVHIDVVTPGNDIEIIELLGRHKHFGKINIVGKVISGVSNCYYTLSSPKRVKADDDVEWKLWPKGEITSATDYLDREDYINEPIVALKLETTGEAIWNIVF